MASRTSKKRGFQSRRKQGLQRELSARRAIERNVHQLFTIYHAQKPFKSRGKLLNPLQTKPDQKKQKTPYQWWIRTIAQLCLCQSISTERIDRHSMRKSEESSALAHNRQNKSRRIFAHSKSGARNFSRPIATRGSLCQQWEPEWEFGGDKAEISEQKGGIQKGLVTRAQKTNPPRIFSKFINKAINMHQEKTNDRPNVHFVAYPRDLEIPKKCKNLQHRPEYQW
jgi:hypothetical protein